MTIRRAEARDIPALHRLLLQVGAVHHRGRPDLFQPGTKYTDEELEALLQDEDRPVFLAEEGGQAVGYAFCALQAPSGNRIFTPIRTLYIDDLCVDEQARGRGIGGVLYRHALSFARAQGCYNVTLNVWSCNPSALHFYEKQGMQPQKIGMEVIL